MSRLVRRASAILALLALALPPAFIAAAAPVGAASGVIGGGSSFAALEIDQWRADTARNPYSLQVNYVSQGSTFGRQSFIDNNLDFGASDIVFQPAEVPQLQAKRCAGKPITGCFVYVPVSAGGLSFMYNLTDGGGHRYGNLQLTRRAACSVFTGAIKRWNDPQIVATNPQLAGFARDIVPVIRADGAGESFVFSQFCLAVAPDIWRNVHRGAHSQRPGERRQRLPRRKPRVELAAELGSLVARALRGRHRQRGRRRGDRPGHDHVRGRGLRQGPKLPGGFAAERGRGVHPARREQRHGRARLRDRARGRHLQPQLHRPRPAAYFPSTYSYVIAQTAGFDPGKGATLGKFLCYSVSVGQVIAPQLRYARLSAPLVQIAINAIVQIPGAPAPNQCFIAGAPPPPPPPSVAEVRPRRGERLRARRAPARPARPRRRPRSEAAAAAAAAKKEAQRQRRSQLLDAKLAAAAGSQGGSGSTPVLWTVLIGAGLAAVVTAIFRRLRRSTS